MPDILWENKPFQAEDSIKKQDEQGVIKVKDALRVINLKETCGKVYLKLLCINK